MQTFKVSEVKVSSGGPMPTWELAQLLQFRAQSAIEAAGSKGQCFVRHLPGHPIIDAAHMAFAYHLPLTLSPDDVWMCIAQGFGAHVNLHAEELRNRLVAHAGSEVISVRRDGFLRGAVNDWPGVVAEFSEKVEAHIGPTRDLVVAAFSTTGAAERMASQIALLGAMQAYFGYELCSLCGISSITLLGEVDDWKSIRRRVVALGDFGLAHWVRSLTPILDQFVAAADGQVDLAFWRSLYKTNSESGESKVTGWINTLFPYLDEYLATSTGSGETGRRFSNPHLDDWQDAAAGATDAWVRASQYPSGLSCAPFIWRFLELDIPMEMLGGFVGVSQDPRTLAVSPAIGWVIREQALPAPDGEQASQ